MYSWFRWKSQDSGFIRFSVLGSKVQGLSNSDFGMRNAELKIIKSFRGSGVQGFRVQRFNYMV
jgi:hypothetical protein